MAISQPTFENKSLVWIILICYLVNILLGGIGYLCPHASEQQIVIFQVGNAFAISASVMAARYTGIRSQHVAASAYILMGITHGISLAALGRESINPDRAMTMVMPMIPALLFVFWCRLYPMWLRWFGLVPAALFTFNYVNVLFGESYFGWPLSVGYGMLQGVEVLWGYYLYRDWQATLK